MEVLACKHVSQLNDRHKKLGNKTEQKKHNKKIFGTFFTTILQNAKYEFRRRARLHSLGQWVVDVRL